VADAMHGIESDVVFDNAAAETFSAGCDSAAGVIEGQSGSRASWKTTALADFEGVFSALFASNASVAATDAAELADRLREVATGVRLLKEEARKEQQRRETAREWKQEQEDRSLLDKGVDSVFGGDDPPVGPAAAEPTIPVSASVNGTRETPAPGSGGGGGGGGTSSARPEDLRTFASGSRGANTTLQSKPTTLRGYYESFGARCQWGRIDAAGVFTGFDQWLTANEEDVRWATTVADAFAAAGGEGAVATLSDSALMASLQAAGIDATRDDIVIDPPTNYGAPPTTGYANDPVNTATGNFLENEVDLGFPGAASALALTRTYNSFDDNVGGFGPGWSSWTEARLDLDDEAARMRLPDGRVIVFPRLGTGWDRATGENLWLETTTDGRLRATDNTGRTWDHTPSGELVRVDTGAGTGVALVREAGRVVRLEHDRGRAFDLHWDAAGERVTGATASDGRHVDYTYDEQGRVTAVASPSCTRGYAWNEAGLIEAVTDADGVVEAENTYDERARVTTQRSQHGRLTRFVYLPGNVTVVSDPDGSRSNTWLHDHRGRLIGVVDAHEQRQSSSYDSHGNLVMLTERDGATTVHEYDDRGRRVRTVTPTGADLTYGYDDLDRVTTVVTESGAVTTYTYDDDGTGRSPATITDPEGGQTHLRWVGGLLTQVTDPTGVTVRFDHDDHGDLVATTDALGNTARVERDTTGRVKTAITPSGARTSYTYGPGGHLAARRDPDGAVWHYEHTTAGRLAATVDPTGARTEVEHGSHGEAARTIDPLGRALTRHLDDVGNLTSVELPDGSRWQFTHDALSRLVATTDPTGNPWTTDYDAVGTPVATTDPTGIRRTATVDAAAGVAKVADGLATSAARFDSLGRVVAAEHEDGSESLRTYDRCGRAVEHVDAEGGLTLVRRDAAGRPVAATSPTGAVTSYDYDACGRLAAVVDAADGRTSFDYDPDGRLVREVLPTGEVARTDYDLGGRVITRHQPGRGVARYAYDAAGRVVRSSDTWYGRRTFRYDAAGQLVEVVNGNGGVTRYDYDANGRVVAIVDPLGNTTRREYDAMNRVVAETDPLGRTTRAGYDGAGRQSWQEDPTGRRLSWTYDESGRVAEEAVDGRTVSAIARDLRARTVQITDHTRGEQAQVHDLAWNRRGQLVSRSRDGRTVSWEYDADGRRTAMTTPDGSRTDYTRDAVGHLVAVDHPLLGRAVMERDASGRLVEATAGGIISTWEHHDGFVVGHTVGDTDGFTRTTVRRDEEGRITALDRDGEGTTYSYDEACQLIEARTGGSVTRWRYDASGRLIEESTDGSTVEHTYDPAGQLTTTTESAGRTRTHSYDGLGRRTGTTGNDGTSRDYRWSASGWLAGVSDRTADGSRETHLHVDALGELAGIDADDLFWDTAAGGAIPVQAGQTPVVAAGPVTGIGAEWTTPGWRSARSTAAADPWAAASQAELPAGFSISGAGELSLPGGLEWLGARVYDPSTRGFLSVDPLDPVNGAGWAGNPYSYAGNDPLHALDPTGLRPVTDAELAAYAAANNGAMAAAGDWMKDNWEYVAGGAMVIAGGVLVATGVGGPAGMMLIGAGADVIIQKATTGDVNWGQVAVMGAAGGLGGAAAAAKWGTTGVRAAVTTGAVSGASAGGAGSAYTYATGPGPHTPGGFVRATASGTVFGGVLGGAGGAAGHGLTSLGGRVLGRGAGPDPNILSGHGGIMPNDPSTALIPDGTNVRFWTTHGDTIPDSLGNRIELGHPPPPVEVAGPGSTVPDYILSRPDGLNIMGNPTTVTSDTRLSQLIQPGMGDVDWAACRYVPGASP